MGIYIKGMEMPKSCYECLVRNQGFSGDGMKCGKTGSVLSWHDGQRKRMDDCPLIPVPPHGRLIDADALISRVTDEKGNYYGHDCAVIGEAVESAPTIIPASDD